MERANETGLDSLVRRVGGGCLRVRGTRLLFFEYILLIVHTTSRYSTFQLCVTSWQQSREKHNNDLSWLETKPRPKG